MHVLCDIAMFYIHFHTLLIIFGLSYLLSAPQCQFLFSAVFLFQVSPILKMLQKFWKNTIKNQCTGSFGNHLGGDRGDPPGPQTPSRRTLGWGRARGRLGPWRPP